MFLTFDIDVFIFMYVDDVQLCWKLWVLYILTLRGEKQESD